MESLQPLMFMMLTSFKNNNYHNDFILYILLIFTGILAKIPSKYYDDLFNIFQKEEKLIIVTIPSHDVPVIRGCSTVQQIKINYSNRFLGINKYLSENHNDKFKFYNEIICDNPELNFRLYDYDENQKKKRNYLYFNSNK